jgi:two-component system response regulator LytT
MSAHRDEKLQQKSADSQHAVTKTARICYDIVREITEKGEVCMIRVILCDDNRNILDLYSSLLKETAKAENVDIKIVCMESGEQILFTLSDDPNSVDIIYLDILMARMNGIEASRKLREIGCLAEIIFLTSSSEYVFQGFDSNPFYYIVKDDMPAKKFRDIFLRAISAVQKRADRYITVTFGGNTTKLPLDKIRYFEVQNRLVTAHTHGYGYFLLFHP